MLAYYGSLYFLAHFLPRWFIVDSESSKYEKYTKIISPITALHVNTNSKYVQIIKFNIFYSNLISNDNERTVMLKRISTLENTIDTAKDRNHWILEFV